MSRWLLGDGTITNALERSRDRQPAPREPDDVVVPRARKDEEDVLTVAAPEDDARSA
jgi:hypothetical protein